MRTDRPSARGRRSGNGATEALDLTVGSTPDRAIDPACAAAIALLKRALAAERADAQHFQGVVVVEVPDPTWGEPMAAAWRDVTGPREPKKASEDEFTFPSSHWVVVFIDDEERRYRTRQAGELVDQALRDGNGLVGISHAPDRLLPSNLVQAADLRLTMSPLDAGVLSAIVVAVTAGAPSSLPDAELCARITPAVLRMARRRGQSPDDFVRRIVRLTEQQKPGAQRENRTLDSLPGTTEAVAWGRDLARDLDAYAGGRLTWRDIDRGCLLVGPPGTGKTTFTCALATTCRVPLIAGSYAIWQSAREGSLDDLLRAMAATFDEARKAAPCILFIDELDSFFNRTGDTRNRDWWSAVVGALLQHLDGLEAREGVVVVGATNHLESVDPAIARSGRLDRVIRIPLPDQDSLAKILRVHRGSDLVAVDLSRPALLAMGSTGADCERWARGARRRARNAGRPMEPEDLLAEIQDGDWQQREDDLRVCAVHEAGHALLQAFEQPGTLQYVSIRGGSGHGGQVAVARRPSVATEEWLCTQLRQLLAGRAAEEMVFGRATGGSGGPPDSDLARATRLALNAETG
jgi:cell division protease FtsH